MAEAARRAGSRILAIGEVAGGRRSPIGDFGFWILDWGLADAAHRRRLPRNMADPKSSIPNRFGGLAKGLRRLMEKESKQADGAG